MRNIYFTILLPANYNYSQAHSYRLCCQGDIRSQKEAAWAVTNYTSGGSTEQVVHLVQMGVLPHFCKLLESQDAKLLLVVMDGLCNILKVHSPVSEYPYFPLIL